MRPNGTNTAGPLPRPGFRASLGWRISIYIAIATGLLLFKVGPDLGLPLLVKSPAPPTVTVTGRDLAPHLIGALSDEYQRIRSNVELRFRAGGTVQGVEDLLNGRAEVTFLNRPLSEEERQVVAAVEESIMVFPIALGGIAVVASKASALERLSIDELRDLLTDGQPKRVAAGQGPLLVYLADPNLGFWRAVAERLDLPDAPLPPVGWLASDVEVVEAVGRDPRAIGIISTLTLSSQPVTAAEWRFVAIAAQPDSPAIEPTWRDLRSGAYLLSHRLYVACLKDGAQKEASFVDFLFSPRGQRLVESERFVAAREVARQILLASTVVGGPG